MLLRISSITQLKSLAGLRLLERVGTVFNKSHDSIILSNPLIVQMTGKDAPVVIPDGKLAPNRPVRLIFGHSDGGKLALLITPAPALLELPASITYQSVIPPHTAGQLSLVVVPHKQIDISEALECLNVMIIQ